LTIILSFGDVVATKLWLTYYRLDETGRDDRNLPGAIRVKVSVENT
jgi:hypothetical protein